MFTQLSAEGALRNTRQSLVRDTKCLVLIKKKKKVTKPKPQRDSMHEHGLI